MWNYFTETFRWHWLSYQPLNYICEVSNSVSIRCKKENRKYSSDVASPKLYMLKWLKWYEVKYEFVFNDFSTVLMSNYSPKLQHPLLKFWNYQYLPWNLFIVVYVYLKTLMHRYVKLSIRVWLLATRRFHYQNDKIEVIIFRKTDAIIVHFQYFFINKNFVYVHCMNMF